MTELVRKNRRTGTTIVCDTAENLGESGDADCRWGTFCEDHGAVVYHRTRRVAISWMAEPEGWCQECRLLLQKKRGKE